MTEEEKSQKLEAFKLMLQQAKLESDTLLLQDGIDPKDFWKTRSTNEHIN